MVSACDIILCGCGCHGNQLKVQKVKLILCAKYQVNRMTSVKSRWEGSDSPHPHPHPQCLRVTFLGLCLPGLITWSSIILHAKGLVLILNRFKNLGGSTRSLPPSQVCLAKGLTV